MRPWIYGLRDRPFIFTRLPNDLNLMLEGTLDLHDLVSLFLDELANILLCSCTFGRGSLFRLSGKVREQRVVGYKGSWWVEFGPVQNLLRLCTRKREVS